jgi:hypothetical protein
MTKKLSRSVAFPVHDISLEEWKTLEDEAGVPFRPVKRRKLQEAYHQYQRVAAVDKAAVSSSKVRPIIAKLEKRLGPARDALAGLTDRSPESDAALKLMETMLGDARRRRDDFEYMAEELELVLRASRAALNRIPSDGRGRPPVPGIGELMVTAEAVFIAAHGTAAKKKAFRVAFSKLVGHRGHLYAPVGLDRLADKTKHRNGKK